MTKATDGIDPGDKKARRNAWRKEGMQVAIDLIKEMREIEGIAGVHVMAIEWEEAMKPIVEGAGLLPRPEVEPLPSPGSEA
jgi:methylenetetrahydrofolate reductase (NADPH)